MIKYYAAIEPPDYPLGSPKGLYRVIEDEAGIDFQFFSRHDEWVSDPDLIHLYQDPDVREISEFQAKAILEHSDREGL